MATEPRWLTSNFFDRLQRVRHTVFRLMYVFLGAVLLAYPFAPRLLHVLVRPLGAKLVMYAPMEGFMGYFAVAVATAFCLTAPFLLYTLKQLLQTVVGLPPKVALSGMLAAGGLFVGGVSFCYLVILPVTLRFFLNFGGPHISAGIAVSRYLSLILGLSAACGVLFELPLLMLVLHHLGLVSRQFLSRNRRYAILAGAVVTAVLTPTPDAFTMSALLLPVVTLYEVSIVLIRLAERHTRRQEMARR